MERGEFHVYAIQTADEGLSLLCGVDAGTADESGSYPPGTVNQMIETRLQQLAAQARKQLPEHGET